MNGILDDMYPVNHHHMQMNSNPYAVNHVMEPLHQLSLNSSNNYMQHQQRNCSMNANMFSYVPATWEYQNQMNNHNPAQCQRCMY